MSDPMNQPGQISLPQGLNDGHSTTSKDSKFSGVLGSDKPTESLATSLSFSSQQSSFSPVAYEIESSGPPENKVHRTFKEKRGPFDSSTGSQKQGSPIKMSPVSERIKALEALAAKQNEFDRNDGGFLHYKDRHYEKSPIESYGISSGLSFEEKAKSAEQDSLYLPFEVLGDAKCGNDIEDTVDWMRASLPPAPDFNIEDPNLDERKEPSLLQESLSKALKASKVDTPEVPETFAGVPDQFMDSPIEMAEINNDHNQAEQGVEEKSEFDLSFLPTAYMWDKQEKANGDTECYQIFPDNEGVYNSPAPPAEFESQSPSAFQQIDATVKHCSTSKRNFETEADSSGESDDTVIEEAGSTPTIEKDETKLYKKAVLNQEKEPIQVPTINVIETEEQVLSDEEEQSEVEREEDNIKYPVLPGEGPGSTEQSNECSDVTEHVSVDTQQKENKSDPDIFSKTDFDAQYSPKHVMIEGDHESEIFLQSSPDSGGLNFEVNLPKCQNLESYEPHKEPSLDKGPERNAEILSDTPLNSSNLSNEQSDEEMHLDHCASEELVLIDQVNADYFKKSKGENTAFLKSSCLVDNKNTSTLVQESFEENITEDYETLKDHNLDLESEPVPSLSEPSADIHGGIKTVLTQTKLPSVDLQDEKATVEAKSFTLKEQELPVQFIDQQLKVHENPPTVFPSLHNKNTGQMKEFVSCLVMTDVAEEAVINSKPEVLAPKDVLDMPDSRETISDAENAETECSVTTDSFVEFMRECLKSKQEELSEGLSPGHVTLHLNPKSNALATTQSSPAMIMDFEKECPTISALKNLGSSQEQDDENPPTVKAVLKPSEAPLPGPNPQPLITSSTTAQTISNKFEPDALFPNDVEAIDIWVAEAYHLAEHVLTTILTHLTVNDLVHWRDPKKSGVVFGVSLLLLLSLAAFSVISVISYLLLALLCVTISFRIYKSIIQAVQKSNEGHPFKALMEKDVTLPPETFRKHVDLCLTHINCVLKQMSRLFLVKDLVDSLKLAVVMWLLTYVGAVFNGITILILADILLFSVPLIYEKNKTQIDHYINIVNTQVNTAIAKLQEKLPGAMKRCKAE